MVTLLGAHFASRTFDPAKFACLAFCDIFQDLSLQQVADLSQSAVKRAYRKGENLYHPDMGEALFVLRSGRVDLCRLSAGGQRVVLVSLGPGSFFGEMPLLGRRMFDSRAEASEDTEACILSHAQVEEVLRLQPKVAWRALEALGRRLRQIEDRFVDVTTKGSEAQVASLLLRLAQQGEVTLSHQQLADMLGVYRITVTVALRRLKAIGLVETGRRHIRLANIDGLHRVASGEVAVPMAAWPLRQAAA